MTNKTILFFSRSELVHLYGMLNKYLKNDFNIVHVAYSNNEAVVLEEKYGVKPDFIFKEELKLQKDNFKVDDSFLNELDELFVKETGGRFNLNGAIQSDRTFSTFEYDEVLKITANYYNVWVKIFSLQPIDFFIHEPTSLMMNHIASVLCKKKGGIYSTHIMIQGESIFNFIMVDHDNGFPTEINYVYESLSKEDVKKNEQRITKFIDEFRSSYEVFFDVLGIVKPNFQFYFKLFKGAIKDKIIRLKSLNKLDCRIDNIERFLLVDKLNEKRLNSFVTYRNIKYDNYNPEIEFYFYPLHLEPEAVVLYWADGIYTNQVKLIENIASQLPPGVFLYVKDHPHLYGYRNVEDYHRIQNIPNVKLLAPQIPGKKIIKDSLGVITLNGTAGFESLLLNKHVITFGSSFYEVSERVKFVKNIKDFREAIYALREVKYEDDDELNKFVLAYLLSNKSGFTNFFSGVADKLDVDMDDNIRNVAKGLTVFFNEYDNFVGKDNNKNDLHEKKQK